MLKNVRCLRSLESRLDTTVSQGCPIDIQSGGAGKVGDKHRDKPF